MERRPEQSERPRGRRGHDRLGLHGFRSPVQARRSHINVSKIAIQESPHAFYLRRRARSSCTAKRSCTGDACWARAQLGQQICGQRFMRSLAIFQLRRRSPTRSSRRSRGHKRIASEGAWPSQQQQQQPPPQPGAQGGQLAALTNLAPSVAHASDWLCADGAWREERSQKLA